MHSYELAFFDLPLDGLDGERHGRRQSQYGPFRVMFRPAGIPHQDEIGPRAFAFTKFEIRPMWQTWQTWQKRLADCSSALDSVLLRAT